MREIMRGSAIAAGLGFITAVFVVVGMALDRLAAEWSGKVGYENFQVQPGFASSMLSEGWTLVGIAAILAIDAFGLLAWGFRDNPRKTQSLEQTLQVPGANP